MQPNPSSLTMKMEMVVIEDLILEILLRLPPISVLRFKSVCKSWYSLISNPCFLRNHACQFHLSQHDRLDPGLLLSPLLIYSDSIDHSLYAILPQDHDQKPKPPPLPPLLKLHLDHSLLAFEQRFSDCCLIDSCNGLLLYHTDSDTPDQYMIFNPITNQSKEIPLMDLLLHTPSSIKPNELDKTMLFSRPHIVFDPSESISSYKLLVVLRRYAHFELYVYSSDNSTASWRLLTSFTEKCIPGWKTFMFDGVFYWLCKNDSICFDVVKECVWLLPLPPTPADYPNRDVHYFGECGGRLRLIEEYYANSYSNKGHTFPYSFDIMEMEQGSAIWTVKSRVILEAGYDHLIQETSDPLYWTGVKVMHLYETVKGEEAVLLNVDYERIVYFNIKTNTFGKEPTFPYFEHYDCLNVLPFTPTLFPLLT